MNQRRAMSRNASEAKAEHAEASRSQRVRRQMRETHRHSFGQQLVDSDDGASAEVVLPRRLAYGESPSSNSRSSWGQLPSGSSAGPLRSSLHGELHRPQEESAPPPPGAARDQLRRPRSQGTIESSSQHGRSTVRRPQASQSSEQRPASAGQIRRQQEASQGRRHREPEQARRTLDADHGRRNNEADARRPARQALGTTSQPSSRQDNAPTASQVSLRAPQEAPDFHISLGGPGLQVAVAGMHPIMLPMEGMIAALDDEDVHPLIAMTRRIEMATQLVRLIEEQTLEERILRAVIEESSEEQLRAALEQSIAEQQSQQTVPPVKEGVLESLPHVVVTKEDLLDETNSQCSICLEKYTPGARATRILCGHLFCTNCITGWLNSANSCPVCRYELPTERTDFEEGRKDRMKGRKAVLKEGDLMMMTGPALKRLLSVLQISSDGCVDKADLLEQLRMNPDVQISLDRSGVCYVEADFAQLSLHAMCSLLQRHGLTIPPPKFHKDEKLMRAEVLRRFGAAGLLETAASPSGASRESESRPATPEVKHDVKTKTNKLRSTRRKKPDVKAKIGRGDALPEQIKVQGLRISHAAGTSEQPFASMEAHPASSSSCLLTDLAPGPLAEEGLANDAEAEEIFLSAEASTSNRPGSRGSNFPTRSSNAARCWEPQKNRVRSLSEKTLRRACDPHSGPAHSEFAEHMMSMENYDSSRAPTGYWFKRGSSLTPGQEVHKSAAPGTPGQKTNLLGRPSKFVQRVRRSFKFGGV